MSILVSWLHAAVALASDRALQNQRADTTRDAARETQDAPVTRCACGYLYTSGEWSLLPLLGVQEGGETPLELRNCQRCGSTVSVAVPRPVRWHAVEPRPGNGWCPCVRHAGSRSYARVGCWSCGGAGVLRGTLVRVPVVFEEWADRSVLKGVAVVQITPGWRGDRESPPEPPEATCIGVELGGLWLPPDEAAEFLPCSDRENAVERWETQAWELSSW